MKRSFLLSVILSLGVFIFSQEFQVPKDYKLIKAEDYAPYEQDVINGINWLADTPINESLDKRKEVNSFLMKWMMGSPNVKIEVREYVGSFLSHSDLLMAFLCGWTKYSLESRDFTNQLKGNVAGIENVIFVYKKNKKIIGKNKDIEKYIQLQKSGKLEQEIAKKIIK